MDCSPFPQAATPQWKPAKQHRPAALADAASAAAEPAPAPSCAGHDVEEARLSTTGGAAAAAAEAAVDVHGADDSQAHTAVGGSAPDGGAANTAQQSFTQDGSRAAAREDASSAFRWHGSSSATSAATDGAPMSEPVSGTQQAIGTPASESVEASPHGPEQLAAAFGAKLHVGGDGGGSTSGGAAATGQGFDFSFKASPNPFSAPARGRGSAAQKPREPTSTFQTWSQGASTGNGAFSSQTVFGAAVPKTNRPAPSLGSASGAQTNGTAHGPAPVFGAAGFWPHANGTASKPAPVFGGAGLAAAAAKTRRKVSTGAASSADSESADEVSSSHRPQSPAVQQSQPSKRQQRTPRRVVKPRARGSPPHHATGAASHAASGTQNGRHDRTELSSKTDGGSTAAGAAAGPLSGSSANGVPVADQDVRMPDHLLRARPRGSPARRPAGPTAAAASGGGGATGSNPGAALLRHHDSEAKGAFRAGQYEDAARHYSEVSAQRTDVMQLLTRTSCIR